MDVAELLGRFEHVSEERDGGYLARCPAHGDSRPSLRIWVGEDRKVRLTCRAGCQTADVVDNAGLKWKDLFDVTGESAIVPKEPPAPVDVAYTAPLADYAQRAADQLHDGSSWAEDARVYAARRFGLSSEATRELGLGLDSGERYDQFPYLSRSFRDYPRLTVPLTSFSGVVHGLQGRDITGECPGRWLSLSNPKGHRWGQYGLFRGQGGYDVTVVTEGPGDALTAAAAGYDAVAVRGAALAGSPELVKELADGMRGSQVIVAGDDDGPGRAFTQKLADGLATHGTSVYTMDIKRGNDLTAWQEDAPETFAAEFHAAVKAAKPAEVRRAESLPAVSVDSAAEAARIMGELFDQYGASDALNAHALVTWTGGRIKWSAGLGFYVWNGSVWEPSNIKVRQEIHRMGAALTTAGQSKNAEGFTMTRRINNLLAELSAVPSVYTEAEEFDARPELLSFRNGTVNLSTGELRPHDKADMLTYKLDIHYDPAATCPRWDAFLTEIMPGMPEMPGYLQRMIGYGITGRTDEQCFTVLWGKGANGKSVFTDTLSDVFGKISRTTPFATFEEKPSGGIPNDIAALRGARLVLASEGDSGKPMSEAVLKRVTGKDKVSARFLQKEFFEFRPQFLLMLASNHKPRFKGQDEGLWRRVKMVPFKRWFAPHERDYELQEKLISEESQGIAAWAVRGAVEWYRNGLGDPQVVTAASKEYRETSDALAGFFPGVLVRDDASTMNGAEAYNDYRDWCEAEGLAQKEIWSRRAFYEAMEERQVSRKRNNKGVALVGIKRADPPAGDAGPGIFSGQ